MHLHWHVQLRHLERLKNDVNVRFLTMDSNGLPLSYDEEDGEEPIRFEVIVLPRREVGVVVSSDSSSWQ